MVKQQPMNRIYVSIALGLGWLLFLALWLLYLVALWYSSKHSSFIMSIVVVTAIAVVLWVPWTMKQV